jgi:hypothetical protein
MTPVGSEDPPRIEDKLSFYNTLIQSSPDSSFHEMTGKIGDVILLHPLMLHTASKNGKRAVRIITNPPIHLNEPFIFNREDGKESLVERKTIQDVSFFLRSLFLTISRRESTNQISPPGTSLQARSPCRSVTNPADSILPSWAALRSSKIGV